VCLVFCESYLADGTFRDVLRIAEHTQSNVPVVVTSRVGDTGEYLEAMELGAFDFLARPYRRAEVNWILSRALGRATPVAA
jgi:DNA-binding NtrC family response regulator